MKRILEGKETLQGLLYHVKQLGVELVEVPSVQEVDTGTMLQAQEEGPVARKSHRKYPGGMNGFPGSLAVGTAIRHANLLICSCRDSSQNFWRY